MPFDPRPPAILPEPEDATINVLQWLTSIGRAGRAALAGDRGAAGRHLADFVLDPVDAAIPGNIFERRARAGDEYDFSDIIGLDEPGAVKSVVDVVGNAATDPLTIAQFTPARSFLAKAGSGALRQAEKVPAFAEATKAIRKATGNMRLRDEAKSIRAESLGDEAATERAWADYARTTLSKYPKELREFVGQVTENVHRGPDGRWVVTDAAQDKRRGYMTNEAQIRDAITRAKRAPGAKQFKPEDIEAAVRDAYGISHGMFAQIGRRGAWDMPEEGFVNTQGEILSKRERDELLTPAAMQSMRDLGIDPKVVIEDFAKPVKFDPETMSKRDYLMRIYEDFNKKGTTEKARTIKDSQSLVDALNDAKEPLSPVWDVAERVAARIPGQGRIVRRQTLGERLFGPDFKSGHRPDATDVRDTGAKAQFKSMLDEETRRGRFTAEEGEVLAEMWDGHDPSPPTGWLSKMLDYGNKRFKQAAVYGILLPKWASLTRNRLTTVAQAAGTEGIGGKAVLGQAKRAIPDVIASVLHDGMGLRIPKDRLTSALVSMEEAIMAGKGRKELASAHLRAKGEHGLADALDMGVVDGGFVGSEQLVDEVTNSKWARLRDAPQRMFQGTEQRARLGLFLDLIEGQKMPRADAAAKTRDALYDYSYSGSANRELRRWLPFAQFVFQAVPREGGKILRNPAAIPIAAELYGQDEDQPRPQWMEQTAALPVGENKFLSGLGLPSDALTSIPNPTGGDLLGETWETLGDLHPLAKTAVSFVSNRDAFTGGPFGGNQRLPFTTEKSDLGKAYRVLEGTGLAEGLLGPVRTLDTLRNPNRSLGSAASQVFFGPTVRDVDRSQTEKALLEKRLSQDSDVKRSQFTRFSTEDPASEEQAMIDRLQALRDEISARKSDAASAR